MSTPTIKRFASPYDDAPPPGAEGWEELYPYYLHFRDDRREFEEARFWFADTQHWPTVFKPFDTITVEFAIRCLGPVQHAPLRDPARQRDRLPRPQRLRLHVARSGVPEEQIPARVPEFLERAGHYFANWPSLLENWHAKIRGVIAELEAIRFEPLPDRVAIE